MAGIGTTPYAAAMRLSKRQITDLRAECDKGGLGAALLAAQFLEMIEKLQVSLDAAEELTSQARRELLRVQAALAETRVKVARAAEGRDEEPSAQPNRSAGASR